MADLSRQHRRAVVTGVRNLANLADLLELADLLTRLDVPDLEAHALLVLLPTGQRGLRSQNGCSTLLGPIHDVVSWAGIFGSEGGRGNSRMAGGGSG